MDILRTEEMLNFAFSLIPMGDKKNATSIHTALKAPILIKNMASLLRSPKRKLLVNFLYEPGESKNAKCLTSHYSKQPNLPNLIFSCLSTPELRH